ACGLVSQEHHGKAAARGGEECPGQRQQEPGAIAGTTVGGCGSTVADTPERLQQDVDDLARRAAVDIGDEADAAGIAFCGWIEERRSGRHEQTFLVEVSASSVSASRRRRGTDAG